MDFLLLGPLEVTDEGHVLRIGGPKQRTVLAHLLLNANRVVAVDRLIDLLWGDAPPETARNVVQTYVRLLRRELGSERIAHRSAGYALTVDPSEVDVLRFETLVAEGRGLRGTDPAAVVRILGQALALWRGPALEDLGRQPSLQAEISRLEELRLAVVEERIGAQLELGRHAELIPDLQTMVGASPLRERLWAHLMLALYRSGRQADALAVYSRARGLLAAELGIDPSPELQHLHEQMLRQDPALALVGEPLRGYRLLDPIGAGAFGSVHRGYQPQVGREVAVKVILPRLANDAEFIRRFETEAQLVARLEHPHIVPLYDYWREPDGAYLVMRYLRGGSLQQALDDRSLDLDGAVRLVDQVGLALATAHRQGVVHRDVKPANILFDSDGNAYLSDFGIARDLAAAVVGRGRTPSSPVYSPSPEETGGGAATPRSDIYSFGRIIDEVLACCLSPTTPGDGTEDRRGAVPGKGRGRAFLPAPVQEVIDRATATDPGDRYAEVVELVAALRQALTTLADHPAPEPSLTVRNPYKGLRPFVESDVGDFFGREALVAELLARLADDTDAARFLAVVGPSGSGKSSLVRAGLIPALRQGALPGSDRWFTITMHPGTDPFEEVAAALRTIAVDPPTDLAQQVGRGDSGLARTAAEVLPAEAELVVVIDQFEELFTLVDDEGVRARFLRTLAATATGPDSRVRMVVTLRADFYDRPLLYKPFGDLFAARTLAVTPLSAEELERAVTGPATRVGVAVDPPLVAAMVAEVAAQPGALPLLQFAATELFDRRTDGRLTLVAFHEIGGVSGALAGRAEELYGRSTEAEREATRQLFLRLVTIGQDGGADTRRRVLRAELAALEVDHEAMRSAVDTLGAHRLLSFDRDPATRGPTVEVAHEALLREWGRLRGWVEAAREDLRVHRRLTAAARDWAGSGQEASFLLRGAHLDSVADWAATSGLALSGEERAFLDASLAERAAERAREASRRDREAALERRSMRRLRALVALFAILGLVASTLTIVAVGQRERAEWTALLAGIRELAAFAIANLDEDPERSMLLALEAVDRADAADAATRWEAVDALYRAVSASRAVLTVPGVGGTLDWSPEGSVFVTEGPEDTGLIDLRDATTGESVRSWHGHDIDVNEVAFNHDGSMLGTTGDDGAARVWETATGTELSSVQGTPDGEVWGPSFSPDGGLAAAAWRSEGLVRVWEPTTGVTVHEIATHEGPVRPRTAFSPDGSHLAITQGGTTETVVVDVASGDEVRRFDLGDEIPADVEWSPDGRWLAIAGVDRYGYVWEADSGVLHDTLSGHTSGLGAVVWSPVDPSRLVTGSEDGTARLWEITDVGARELLVLSAGDYGGVWGVAFSPDGQRVMTGDFEVSAVKIWDVGSVSGAESIVLPADVEWFGEMAFTPDGRVATTGPDGSVTFWDTRTGQRTMTIDNRGPAADPSTFSGTFALDISPDGTLAATGGSDRTATVWDVATGEDVFTVDHDGEVFTVVWSPDGRFLASGGAEGVTRIVARTGEEVAILPEDAGFSVDVVAFSPDGQMLATVRRSMGRELPAPQVKVWDWARGEVVRTIDTMPLTMGVSFDPTGTLVATAQTEGTVELWDLDTGDNVATLVGHTGGVFDVSYSPDGSLVATASRDATVRVWEATSGTQALTLRGHTSLVVRVVFSPDGSRLASRSADTTVRVWTVDVEELIAIARSKLTRGLTDEECRQYLQDACTT